MLKGLCAVINSLLNLHNGQYETNSLLKNNVTQCGKNNNGNNMLLISNNVPEELCVCVYCMCILWARQKKQRKLTTEQILCNVLTGSVIDTIDAIRSSLLEHFFLSPASLDRILFIFFLLPSSLLPVITCSLDFPHSPFLFFSSQSSVFLVLSFLSCSSHLQSCHLFYSSFSGPNPLPPFIHKPVPFSFLHHYIPSLLSLPLHQKREPHKEIKHCPFYIFVHVENREGKTAGGQGNQTDLFWFPLFSGRKSSRLSHTHTHTHTEMHTHEFSTEAGWTLQPLKTRMFREEKAEAWGIKDKQRLTMKGRGEGSAMGGLKGKRK